MKTLGLFLAILLLPVLVHAAWNEFYMISGGSNTNSGSTTDLTAPVLSSSGSWGNSGTLNRYISTAAVFGSAQVGQMASIYFATTTGNAVFIASIVAVVSNTTIDLDTTTIKYGVIPSTTGTNQYACKIGGAWGDFAVTGNIFNARVVPQSTRINVKAATYANVANTRTLGSSGGNGNLIWWRGYKTTPGDQDSNNLAVEGTDIPSITFTTGQLTVSGGNQTFSNLSISGAISNIAGLLDVRAPNLSFYRCRVVNSSNVANGFALVQNSAARNLLIQSCYFQASTLATNVVQGNGNDEMFMIGSVINGGNVGLSFSGAGSTLYGSVLYGSASNAVAVGGTGPLVIINNSFYQPGGNGLNFAAPALTGTLVFNNQFENTSTAINSVTSTNTVHISGNGYFGNSVNISTTITEGFTIYDNATFPQSAFVAPSVQNFSILPVGQGVGIPSLFENLPNQPQSYVDVGAAQHKGIPGGGFSLAN